MVWSSVADPDVLGLLDPNPDPLVQGRYRVRILL